MTHAIEARFARDPSRGAEQLEEENLGCLLCSNSRADYRDLWCQAARVAGMAVSRVRFPHSGPGCPMFVRRANL